MENTLENKAKFFAQYLGQKVFNDGDGDYLYFLKGRFLENLRHQEHLVIKPLSSITDEDAIDVARIITGKKLQSDIQLWINDIKKELEITASIGVWRIEVFHHLQYKGYALPYMGLSVEKQIEYGWIKLNK